MVCNDILRVQDYLIGNGKAVDCTSLSGGGEGLCVFLPQAWEGGPLERDALDTA